MEIKQQLHEELLNLVAEMRQAQRDYFAMRSYNMLQKSKVLEKKVDAKINEIRNLQSNGIHIKTSFFDNEDEFSTLF